MAASKGRLIIDAPAAGSWNMAVDQALLQTAETTGQATFRIYFWEPATVSLGYFQEFSNSRLHEPSAGCPLVRRKTGGGAIVHDREITYSFCVPSTERWSKKNRDLYDIVHQSLIDFLGQYSIRAELYGEPHSGEVLPNKDSFLCFERRAIGDLILDGYKVGGSAQRRLKRSLLQHGSILLERSEYAPELPGIADLANSCPSQDNFVKNWVEMLSDCLSVELELDSLSNKEEELAKGIESEIFASSQWNQNR
jgi:lipoate-protein ligase A